MEKWRLRRFMKLGKRRQEVIKILLKEPFMVSEIAFKTHTSVANISRILNQLEKTNLVKCLNPKAIKGRVYTVTELGKKIIKET